MTMLVQESLLHCRSMQEDEADETLSLSDLPLYGDQSVEDWEDQSQGSSSISSSEQDYFEFFSHELSPSAAAFPPENFIFCGKILPYRKPDASENVPSKVVESKKETNVKKTWGVFGWKFGFSRSSKRQVQSKNGEKSTTLMHKKDDSPKRKYNSKQHGKGYGLPLRKMPILTSTPSGKARWYLFLSGISRFSSEMGLRDIKSRQSRHGPPPYRSEKVAEETTGGLSGLIRVLSCGGNHHPNTMVIGSITRNRLN